MLYQNEPQLSPQLQLSCSLKSFEKVNSGACGANDTCDPWHTGLTSHIMCFGSLEDSYCVDNSTYNDLKSQGVTVVVQKKVWQCCHSVGTTQIRRVNTH